MGGFRLLGPNYTIQSLPAKYKCKCMGYIGEINEDTEQELVNNPTKTLPLYLQELLKKKAHIGDNLLYRVISREEDKDFEGARERFKKKQQRIQRERQAEMDYDNWTPWDGKSLESVSTREMSFERTIPNLTDREREIT